MDGISNCELHLKRACRKPPPLAAHGTQCYSVAARHLNVVWCRWMMTGERRRRIQPVSGSGRVTKRKKGRGSEWEGWYKQRRQHLFSAFSLVQLTRQEGRIKGRGRTATPLWRGRHHLPLSLSLSLSHRYTLFHVTHTHFQEAWGSGGGTIHTHARCICCPGCTFGSCLLKTGPELFSSSLASSILSSLPALPSNTEAALCHASLDQLDWFLCSVIHPTPDPLCLHSIQPGLQQEPSQEKDTSTVS